ncbi:hypothetical protein FRX31_011302, partial [Thalictrum thalictroides]
VERMQNLAAGNLELELWSQTAQLLLLPQEEKCRVCPLRALETLVKNDVRKISVPFSLPDGG